VTAFFGRLDLQLGRSPPGPASLQVKVTPHGIKKVVIFEHALY